MRRSPIPVPVRVASVPSDHVYVRHLSAVDGSDGVLRLPQDPPGPWRPSPVLEPGWVRAHAADLDLVHVHFGFEHRTLAELREWVGVLAELDLPLVVTVHDLSNPHLVDQLPHEQALAVLLSAASQVVTLTPGAAAEIAARWGRTAWVLPHPHVVPLARLARPRPAASGFVVDLHTSSRANNAAATVRPELTAVVAELADGRLLEPPAARLSDEALWDRLSSVDVLVLPYRAGTHSGFVEACHDLGTTVVAARVGHLAEQQRVLGFDLGVPGSLTAALQRAHRARPTRRASADERTEQREALARSHFRLYDLARTA